MSGRPIDGPRRNRDAGVTLVEILVVLALIGVTTGVVAISLRPGDRADRGLRQDADLLAARLNIATEAGLIHGHAVAFDWEGDSYRFLERDGDDWQPHRNPRLAASHSMSGLLTRDDQTGGQPQRQGRLTMAPGAGPPEGGVALFAVSDGAARLQIRFDGFSADVEAPQ